MLSGEGNEKGEEKNNNNKKTIGLISKKATLHVQHTFLYIFLPLFCATKTWNFQKIPGYTFYGVNVVRVLVHFVFSLSLIFTPLAFLIFSPPLQNGMLFLQQKMSSLFFLSRSSSFSRWASLACHLTFSFSLSSFFSIFRICGHDN